MIQGQSIAGIMEEISGRLRGGKVGFVALILIGGFVLAACGGGASPANQAQPTGTPAGNPEGAANSSDSGSQSVTPTPGAMPGGEEFGLSMEELVNNVEAVEALIADCMSDAGFEYIAVDFNTIRQGMVSDKSLPGLSERQFIDQYGYGITTLYTGLAPQLSEVRTPAQIGLGERNIQIFSNLSPADQEAYNHTLFGEHPDATLAVALEVEDFSRTGGCTRSAIEQVFQPEQLNASYTNPLDAMVDQDPRMIAALESYAACLRAEGFEYNHEREIEPDLRNRLDDVTQGVPVDAMSDDARAALNELQGYERALAAVATDCENRILDPVANQIERELIGR